MSIKITQEMVDAFGAAWTAEDTRLGEDAAPGARRRAGIRAVLDIVERDRLGSGPKSMAEVMRESAGEA